MTGLLLALAATAAAAPAPLAVVGGTVVVGDGRVIEGGTVLIEGERIVAVDADVAIPPAARRFDATGKVVWPGMIDPFTTLGLAEVSSDRATNDANEGTSTSTAQLRASDGIDADATPIEVTRIAGITTVLVSPGTKNPINGQAAVIDLAGRTAPSMLVLDPAGLVLNLAAKREDAYPATRPGTVAMIRQALEDARAYAAKRARRGPPKADTGAAKPGANGEETAIDLGKEALALALAGTLPVIAVAPEARDVLAALALAREFGLRLALAGAREAWKVTSEIAAAGVPVLLGDTFASPGDRDPFDRHYRLAATLHAAGIPIAFTTRSNHSVRCLPEHAAMAVTYGLPRDAAVRALALGPARILGIDRDRGSLEAGKVANVVVWSGDPLQITSRPELVLIRGAEIPLRSRQEALRDRFAALP